MSLAYLRYPEWLTPQIAEGLPIRWYGAMYLLAFATAFLLFRHEAKRSGLTQDHDEIATFFYWVILGALLGGRLFYVFVFGDTPTYLRAPWRIVWPFSEGRFTGIQGMSYHGGLLGAVAGVLLFARVRRVSILDWGDTLAVAAPLGYTFGRLGNFINGELTGRVTTVSWGMIFPQVPRFTIDETWVQDVVDQTGLPVEPGAFMVNLPRHPSQLYEAFLEGIVLWVILWFVFRPRKPFPGALIALYVTGYGLARFLAEYFRATDETVGYVLALGTQPQLPQFTTSVLHLTAGQVISLSMFGAGLVLFAILRLVAPAEGVVETFDHPN
ncbi:MAG: prolipoprotein diacylglyceryl transferase [Spirochaetota bacterium]